MEFSKSLNGSVDEDINEFISSLFQKVVTSSMKDSHPSLQAHVKPNPVSSLIPRVI